MDRLLAACAAGLLFAAQPLAAKWLLPDFGGSPSVWIACLLVFQVSVIIGYALAQRLLHAPVAQARWTIASLTVLAGLSGWMCGGQPPLWPNLPPMLGALAGLAAWAAPAAALLATTSPLLQGARAARGAANPYRLSAWSNLGSLLGLIAYPFVIEPYLGRETQSWVFTAGYVIIGLALWHAVRPLSSTHTSTPAPASPILWRWWILPALGTIILAGHTHVICQEIAPMPLLWVVPLALYLITWMLPFAWLRSYHRGIALTGLGLAHAAILFGPHLIPVDALGSMRLIATHLVALWCGCWICHGELAHLTPPPHSLGRFWTLSAIGGATGTAFVAFIAPALFVQQREHVLAAIIIALIVACTPRLAIATVMGARMSARSRWRWIVISLIGLLISVPLLQFSSRHDGTIAQTRTFFGVLSVRDTNIGQHNRRELRHGATVHGIEMIDGQQPPLPTAYYGASSGLGEVLTATHSPRRIGAVGLGVGTLAAWLQPGDHVMMVELDPAVTDFAQTYFHFLARVPNQMEIRHGDGRRLFSQDTHQYDLLVLDAFSGDAIPTHLLTVEAFQLWRDRLRPQGICCIHISNRHLDVAPVIRASATSVGWQCIIIHDEPDTEDRGRCEESTWAVCSPTASPLYPFRSRADFDDGQRILWTDDRVTITDCIMW